MARQVTLLGETNAARIGASLVLAAGRAGGMVTRSLRQYEDAAVHLAQSPGVLLRFKRRLRAQRDALDPASAVRRFGQEVTAGQGADDVTQALDEEEEGVDDMQNQGQTAAVLFDNSRWVAGYERALAIMLELRAAGEPAMHVVATS